MIWNATYNQFGSIDCEYNHPEWGRIPTTITEEEYPELWAAALEAGVAPYVEPPAPDPTGEDVNRERARRLEAGAAFPVSWQAEPIPMTGRPFDQTVILGLMQKAQMFLAQQLPYQITYRAADNVTHHLEPAQFIELGSAGMAWVEAVMSASWAMKDAGIPADYTDDAHWP